MSTPLALTIDHPAVRLCAAYRYTTPTKAMEFLEMFDVERARWCEVAAEAAWLSQNNVTAVERTRRQKYLGIIADLTERVLGETP